MKSLRVCVVGGGGSGLACARVLASEDFRMKPVVFEQTSFIGGQWHYDPDGTSETSAVYRNLRTNLPCSIMQFSDFPFPTNEPDAYVGYQEMEDYLLAYAEKHDLKQYIRLNTKVISIDELFNVTYSLPIDQDNENVSQRENQVLLSRNEHEVIYSEPFDAICVANGHYSEIYIPKDIPGFETRTFPIIHSRVYREAANFRDQCVVVVGGSHSGIDIAGEIAAVAKKVFLSVKEENDENFQVVLSLLRLSGKILSTEHLSTAVCLVPSIERIDKDTVVFRNQQSIQPDLIIFATGYHYHMPFLQGKLQVDQNRLYNDRYVYPLYKQLFHADFPCGELSFLCIPFRIIPFPLAELQSHLIGRVLSGLIKLPSRDEMIREIEDPSLPRNRAYHCAKGTAYVENLLRLMEESDKYFSFKFTINQRREIRRKIQ